MNIFANWTAHQKNIVTFVVALDCIWRARNKNIFENCPHNFEDICQEINTRSNELIQVYNQQLTVKPDTYFNTSFKGIGWQPPRNDWIKLNSDGAVADNGSKARRGGIIRSSKSEYILGFARNMSSWQNFLQYSTV